MAGGGPVGQVASNINSSNPLGPQQGQSTPPTGGTGQMPSFANNSFAPPQNQGPGTQNQFGGGFGGGQQPAMLSDMQKPAVLSDMQSDMQYRPERQQPFGGQFGRPMQNPFQPQPPAYMQSPEFQGYQTQMQGLRQQMDEYMRKAPMYQQLEDLNNKMQAYQQRQQQAMQQQMMQRPSPFRQNPYQRQLGSGIQGLMGMLGGRGGMAQLGSYEQYADTNNRALASPTQEVKRPTMSRADFEAREQQLMFPTQAARASEAEAFFEALRNRNRLSPQVMSRLQQPMTMDMPQYQGRSFDLPTNFMKNGGKV